MSSEEVVRHIEHIVPETTGRRVHVPTEMIPLVQAEEQGTPTVLL